MQPEPGTMVTPNVRLLSPLRAGGMGTVWVAEHLTLETEVAVKFISAEFASRGDGALERFRREAKAAAQLRSPHVVKLLDHGVTDDGLPYIVMELLEGETLQDRLARGGRLPLAAVAEVVQQTCKALGEAHRRGTVHRDIKPSNLFLTRLEDEILVKVLDFGIAKAGEETDTDVTSTGTMIGTLHYMSPEQMKDARAATPSSDLWSLAVVAYHALTGRRPFEATTPVALWQQMTSESFTPPSELVDVGQEIDDWFRRGLSADAHDRFASAKDMARAFAARTSGVDPSALGPSADFAESAEMGGNDDAALATNEFVALASLDVDSDAEPAEESRGSSAASTEEAVAPPPSRIKRRRSLVQGFVLGALSLALIAAGAYFVVRQPPPREAAPSAMASAATTAMPAGSTPSSAPATVAKASSVTTETIEPATAPTRKHWPIGCTAERRPCGVGCCMWDHGCEPIGCTSPLPAGAEWDLRLAVVGIFPTGEPGRSSPLHKAELWLRIGKDGQRKPVFPDQPLRISTADLLEPLYTWVQPNVDPLPEVVDLPPRGPRSPTGLLLCRGLILQADRGGMTYQVWLSLTPAGQEPPERCGKAQP